MTLARIAMMALLATALGLSACGIKGDPDRPGPKEDLKKQGTS